MNVFRFRRIHAVHHHTHQSIIQCAIDEFSIFLNSFVDLLLNYKWSFHWCISEIKCKNYVSARPHDFNTVGNRLHIQLPYVCQPYWVCIRLISDWSATDQRLCNGCVTIVYWLCIDWLVDSISWDVIDPIPWDVINPIPWNVIDPIPWDVIDSIPWGVINLLLQLMTMLQIRRLPNWV